MLKCIRPKSCQGSDESSRQLVVTTFLSVLFTNTSVSGAAVFDDDAVVEQYNDLLCVEPYKGEIAISKTMAVRQT